MIQTIHREPLDHFAWVIAQHPDADKLELMKLAFNHGLAWVSINMRLHETANALLFQQMLSLNTQHLDPPLTPEQWRRGP